jgi:hypothetical protein
MVALPTPTVVMSKDPLVALAAMASVAGDVATAVLLLERFSVKPPVGAACDNATEIARVLLRPSVNTAGDNTIVGNVSTRMAAVASPKPSLLTVIVEYPTATAFNTNCAEVAPAATVTVVGTVATDGTLLTTSSVNPPVGAAAPS